jgi:RHS repeat-associated protein
MLSGTKSHSSTAGGQHLNRRPTTRTHYNYEHGVIRNPCTADHKAAPPQHYAYKEPRAPSSSSAHAGGLYATYRYISYTYALTGVRYYGRRYYNPGLGRWLGRDPIAEKGGKHLYAFVSNNPVGLWDYLGMCGRAGEPPCPTTFISGSVGFGGTAGVGLVPRSSFFAHNEVNFSLNIDVGNLVRGNLGTSFRNSNVSVTLSPAVLQGAGVTANAGYQFGAGVSNSVPPETGLSSNTTLHIEAGLSAPIPPLPAGSVSVDVDPTGGVSASKGFANVRAGVGPAAYAASGTATNLSATLTGGGLLSAGRSLFSGSSSSSSSRSSSNIQTTGATVVMAPFVVSAKDGSASSKSGASGSNGKGSSGSGNSGNSNKENEEEDEDGGGGDGDGGAGAAAAYAAALAAYLASINAL